MEKALSARLWCPPAATSTVSSPRLPRLVLSQTLTIFPGDWAKNRWDQRVPGPCYWPLRGLQETKEVIKIVEHHSDSDHTLTSPGKEGRWEMAPESRPKLAPQEAQEAPGDSFPAARQAGRTPRLSRAAPVTARGLGLRPRRAVNGIASRSPRVAWKGDPRAARISGPPARARGEQLRSPERPGPAARAELRPAKVAPWSLQNAACVDAAAAFCSRFRLRAGRALETTKTASSVAFRTSESRKPLGASRSSVSLDAPEPSSPPGRQYRSRLPQSACRQSTPRRDLGGGAAGRCFSEPQFPHLCNGAICSCAPPGVDVGLAGRENLENTRRGPFLPTFWGQVCAGGVQLSCTDQKGPRLLLAIAALPPSPPSPPPPPPPRCPHPGTPLSGGAWWRCEGPAWRLGISAQPLAGVLLALDGSLRFL
ncbi:uncharacterized protein LOC122707436 [Cervus elaphus]|uniref:uncharacterized protein LOC122707436 n=1 Tax=Cervus elaphus TaxID=9860 RepID=UPI001CC30F5F|nr:uncharacterized protein LOC122707436 [Cervus elaphus]